MIFTKSAFYYGFVIDSSNSIMNFNEGSGELTAQLSLSRYSMTDLAEEVQRALNDNGTLDYTVSFNRDTRVMTISATGTFDLLTLTGSNFGLSAYDDLGYDITSDHTGASSYVAEYAAGTEFTPQLHLQNYISFDDWQEFAASKVNESASGRAEVYSLGQLNFSELNIKYQNDGKTKDSTKISYSLTGISDLRSFMQYAITKGSIEFIPDVADRSTFVTMILESTPSSGNGTGFKLKEMVSRGFVGFYETGKLKFRKI